MLSYTGLRYPRDFLDFLFQLPARSAPALILVLCLHLPSVFGRYQV